ncbi:receptor-interacting serine/threonine-protein kinase 4-like [Nasonia vitripennis]|uniref:Uncharacterized protein n=1 Tax=Nasonia vitripennis TaxID=7425 RepID=A0A7M7H379_NASVI|nr:receptor-interacting serine/threonine-protein kinase 4-like [Nasonia vitripennis]XP_008205835.1 receptor-interacting serine/threonine-protein kinase 4-like [Nasonia vitripennis]XP_008205852.1 receptor-interacting serine/threonine-protein kinase 4-like [Nasonia vitripennis]XP_008205860.1 receptor-interacting serine/threonine-protein kinase 4-like [Nasonia vitripennis]XP_032456880.1 receptor-interacting serine/threonine-protein kinase 4-like [Nasonia vitripennis]
MGVPLDAKSSIGFQPIHLAAARPSDTLLKLYLDMGADANALAEDGLSPLHMAARSQVPATTLSTLLKRGANIHLKTTQGRTALHEACANSREDNIRLLLSAGADMLAEDCDGKTPFTALWRSIEPPYIESPSVRLMIKALALKKDRLQPSVKLKDERLVRSNPGMREYYRDCRAQIARLKLTRLTEDCTFLQLLTKSCEQIAGLMMRNGNFKANFRLYDFSGFAMYAEDALAAFKRAQRRRRCVREREGLVSEAFDRPLPAMPSSER